MEAAHEQGVVHRDLKPSNIKVRPDGTVKVLDFGIAKTVDPPAASTAAAMQADSPTTTGPVVTQLGAVFGTTAYMSPEQTRGLTLDRRTDIWSFGCVLYEMLTSRPPFTGQSVSDVRNAIMGREPDWTSLPAATPRQSPGFCDAASRRIGAGGWPTPPTHGSRLTTRQRIRRTQRTSRRRNRRRAAAGPYRSRSRWRPEVS